MVESVSQVRSLDDLRSFIHLTLSRHENLLEGHFALHESILIQNGQGCGMQFILRGPRSVRLNAIWNATRNEVLMYDAQGQRFGRVRLSSRISLPA